MSFARQASMLCVAKRSAFMFVAILLVTAGSEVAQSRQLELPTPEAWEALKRGDAAKAASLFREELDRSPRNPMLHFGAGWAAYALGEYDAATSALKRALEYNSSFGQAAALLGMVAYANSDLDLAIRSMEKAAALAPNDTGIRRQFEQWKEESAVHAGLDEVQPSAFACSTRARNSRPSATASRACSSQPTGRSESS